MKTIIKSLTILIAIYFPVCLYAECLSQTTKPSEVATQYINYQKKQKSTDKIKKIEIDQVTPGFTLTNMSFLKREPMLGKILYSGPHVNLVDLHGNIVHSWKGIYAERVRLLPNGNLLACDFIPESYLEAMQSDRIHAAPDIIKGIVNQLSQDRVRQTTKLLRQVIELNWEGGVLRTLEAPDMVHHDCRLKSDGTLVLMVHKPVSIGAISSKKKYRKQPKDPGNKWRHLGLDQLVSGGLLFYKNNKKTWEWYSHNHVDIDKCKWKKCNINNVAHPDWSHFNSVSFVNSKKYLKKGPFKPGDVIIHANVWKRFLILDQFTGKVLYDYKDKNHMHDVQMIPDNFPGAGNILVFNNGDPKWGSTVFELEPLSKRIKWMFVPGREYYSKGRGSLERLSNGNTIMAVDDVGTVLEVNQKSEVVWEYQAKADGVVPPLRRSIHYPLDFAPQLVDHMRKKLCDNQEGR